MELGERADLGLYWNEAGVFRRALLRWTKKRVVVIRGKAERRSNILSRLV